MKNKIKAPRVPRQSVNTWRLVMDFTEEQALEYRQLMGATNNSAVKMLELMRIGRAQVDGYTFIEYNKPWERMDINFGGQTATMTCRE
jgi:hypothetical protein